MNISLLASDVGFDLRPHGFLRIGLPLRGVHTVQHHPAGTCTENIESVGTLVEVTEALARAGYAVVACETANGRDVQCTPAEQAPPGDGDLYGDICWAVQHAQDNYWVRGATMHAALSHAGWSERDLRPTPRVPEGR